MSRVLATAAHVRSYGRWVQGIQVRALGSALAARSKASSGISKVRISSTGSAWRTNSRSIAHPPYDASANSRDKYTVSSNRYPQASQDHTCTTIRQMLRPFRCNDIRPALRTLFDNYPSHGHFLHFCFFEITRPAWQCCDQRHTKTGLPAISPN